MSSENSGKLQSKNERNKLVTTEDVVFSDAAVSDESSEEEVDEE